MIFDSTDARPIRPKITFEAGELKHNGKTTRFVLRRNLISVGCSDVTPEALGVIWQEYLLRFPRDEEFIIQAGNPS